MYAHALTRLELMPYPGTASTAVSAIDVEVQRLGDVGLSLRYRAWGDTVRLCLPPIAESGRADGLWRHTCFEAFIRPEGESGYLELNAASSGQWATYRFTDYRRGMVAANVEPWAFEVCLHNDHLELAIEMEPGRFAQLDLPTPGWQVGLSAVIEDIDGSLTYWAPAHPSDKPDFHHPDSFVLTLPAPEPA